MGTTSWFCRRRPQRASINNKTLAFTPAAALFIPKILSVTSVTGWLRENQPVFSFLSSYLLGSSPLPRLIHSHLWEEGLRLEEKGGISPLQPTLVWKHDCPILTVIELFFGVCPTDRAGLQQAVNRVASDTGESRNTIQEIQSEKQICESGVAKTLRRAL